ncbi:MAG: precorrin-8X methylmutase, partial [Clostridia bacterium]|nr:precorrin-8X methylmutase [Clostridia bacterium]
MEKELTRATVDPKYTWDLTRIYESDEAWEKAFADTKAKGDEIAAMAGTLKNGKDAVLAALNMENDLEQALSCIYTYAMMKTNEEMTVSKYQAMLGRAGSLVSEIMAKGAFLTPELLSLDEEVIKGYIADPDVAQEAKDRGITRSAVSMERAAQLEQPCIFAIGNAPTALIALHELMEV